MNLTLGFQMQQLHQINYSTRMYKNNFIRKVKESELKMEHNSASKLKKGCRKMESAGNIPPKAQNFELILGSASMARRDILSNMGYHFSILTADIDERSIRLDKPEELVVALAEAKADAIILRLKSSDNLEETPQAKLLITADSVVVCKGLIREKPSSKEEARHFIRDYSGGSAEIVSSVLVTNLVTGNRKGGWESAEVNYQEIPDEVIDSLIEEGLILNVAGALMLEHPLTLPLVKRQEGSNDCIMGLPISLTEKLIQEVL